MPQKEINPWKIGKERPGRNPILAERTPRRNFIGWEFAPPAAEPAPPRWQEPEQALSILDMLSSQQKKIQAERTWKQESEARIRKFEETVKTNQLIKAASSGSFSDTDKGGCPPESARTNSNDAYRSFGGGGMESGRSGYETSRDSDPGTRRIKKDLLDIPVSHIKSLQKTCPAVLSNYRAQRAQKYIQTVHDPDPRAPPKKAEEHRTSFRPAGMLTRKISHEDTAHFEGTKKNKTVASRRPQNQLTPIPRSEEDLLAELKKLTTALESTNEEIERQTLKIALSKKVKTYEKRNKT